ncbi:MAG: pseudouridine synthase [PVC group bacterium]
MRLQKYLSQAGVASRREAERMMLRGRVSVNGRPATEPGTVVDPAADTVEVDGRVVRPEKKIYLMLHKPSGCLCSLRDRFGRPLVTDLIPGISERLYPAGRLDLDSEGLLVLTNDGAFAQKLTHPSHRMMKTYRLELAAPLSVRQEDRMKKGVRLDDGFRTAPARVRILSPDRRRVEVVIGEGKKRQVKRMLQAVGNKVSSLQRMAIGPLALGGLPRGMWRRLNPSEVSSLNRIMNKLE